MGQLEFVIRRRRAEILPGLSSVTSPRQLDGKRADSIDFPPTTPKLEIDYQPPTNRERTHILGKRDLSGSNTIIHSGDQVAVPCHSRCSSVLYLYWYDADGQAEETLA